MTSKADDAATADLLDRVETILDHPDQFSKKQRQRAIRQMLDHTASLTEFNPFDIEITRITDKMHRQWVRMCELSPIGEPDGDDPTFLKMEQAWLSLKEKYERWCQLQQQVQRILEKAK